MIEIFCASLVSVSVLVAASIVAHSANGVRDVLDDEFAYKQDILDREIKSFGSWRLEIETERRADAKARGVAQPTQEDLDRKAWEKVCDDDKAKVKP